MHQVDAPATARPFDEVLASRVGAIRRELSGGAGVFSLARALAIPARTWEDYERGVAMSAGVMLRFLELTGVEPHWLLTGEGPRYRIRAWAAGPVGPGVTEIVR